LKTIKITEEIHRQLTKVKGELEASDGKTRHFGEVILFLTEFWKKHK
jgi:predicted CopG family antitoxin